MRKPKVATCLLSLFITITCLLVYPVHSAGEMVLVKGGCYEMGDTFNHGYKSEKPVHTVCLEDFFIDQYEVTQKEYRQVMGENPSKFQKCADCPVERVTWFNANDYCEKVGKRLPTEAEWEYAARSRGREEEYAGTSGNAKLDAYAWYAAIFIRKKTTSPVGQKKPNGLGLYDMSGNVWEWVADRYDHDYYKNSPRNNPQGPASGEYRVLRGGSWTCYVYDLRNTNRLGNKQDGRDFDVGFRCAKSKE